MPYVRNRYTGLVHQVPAGHFSLPPENPQAVPEGEKEDKRWLEYDVVPDPTQPEPTQPQPQPKAK